MDDLRSVKRTWESEKKIAGAPTGTGESLLLLFLDNSQTASQPLDGSREGKPDHLPRETSVQMIVHLSDEFSVSQ